MIWCIGKNQAEVALIQNLNQELLFERIKVQMKYLKFKPKLAFKYGPYWTKTNYHKPKFHQKISRDAKVSLCQHDPMKSFYSHDLLFIYSNANHQTWVKRVLSYYYYLFFFFFFSFSFFNSSLSGFRNLSPISHQDLSQNFCFFF